MTTIQEQINQIVTTYNQTEIEQQARFRQLFYLVKARHGRRFIRFSGAPLDNCWDLPDNLDGGYFLDKHNRQITEVEPGNE